jgi:hypothetical protein
MKWTTSKPNYRTEFHDCPPYHIIGSAEPDGRVFTYEAFQDVQGERRLLYFEGEPGPRPYSLEEAKRLCEAWETQRALRQMERLL